MFATLREMFVKKLSKEGYLEPSFPNLTASHVSKDSLSRRVFLWARRIKSPKPYIPHMKNIKGLTLIGITSRKIFMC